MRYQVGLLGELPIALVTVVDLLAGVRPPVGRQLRTLHERHVAHFTQVLLLLSPRTLVPAQRRLGYERFIASLTHILFLVPVRALVCGKLSRTSKVLATRVTVKTLLKYRKYNRLALYCFNCFA